ncbi:hypothetical protein PVAG01_01164 [Phlyctema vagabunda]|uniref:Uncharacterized protein n=1 Tax=Phlyctema vagabunda TaxID=108571 RepID=A0ABR4PWN5_9HELO
MSTPRLRSATASSRGVVLDSIPENAEYDVPEPSRRSRQQSQDVARSGIDLVPTTPATTYYQPPPLSVQRGALPEPTGEANMQSHWSDDSSSDGDRAVSSEDAQSTTGLLRKVTSTLSLKPKKSFTSSSVDDSRSPPVPAGSFEAPHQSRNIAESASANPPPPIQQQTSAPTTQDPSPPQTISSHGSPLISPNELPGPTGQEGFRGLSLNAPDQGGLLGFDRRNDITNWVNDFTYGQSSSEISSNDFLRELQGEENGTPAIMAISTTTYQELAKDNFKISDGRFTFLHHLTNMDEPFYVAPPPTPTTSEYGSNDDRPSYFRRIKFSHMGMPTQIVNVAPMPGRAPSAPVGPTAPTGLALHDKFCKPLQTDQKVGDYPPGNAAGNRGFHIFVDAGEGTSLASIDTSRYRSDYYDVPLFESPPAAPVKNHELKAPSTSSSRESDIDWQQWGLSCVPPRHEQTPAQAMMLFLHQHGWSRDEIAKKLGPLEPGFLFDRQSSRWYRSDVRLPDVYGLSMELVDRICEKTAAEAKPWELVVVEGGAGAPAAASRIKWRVRDGLVGLLVPKVLENYLYRALDGSTPHTDVNYF